MHKPTGFLAFIVHNADYPDSNVVIKEACKAAAPNSSPKTPMIIAITAGGSLKWNRFALASLNQFAYDTRANGGTS